MTKNTTTTTTKSTDLDRKLDRLETVTGALEEQWCRLNERLVHLEEERKQAQQEGAQS